MSTASPRVSVVLPVYNRRSHVAEAIASVRAQTRPADELVVVDDGSTDDSVAIVERAAGPGTIILRQPNRGIGAARNRGLAAATGERIAFIDSDDLWEPAKLALQGRVLDEDESADLVFGHVREFLSPERATELASTYAAATAPIPGPIATTLLARRSAIDRIGPFDETLRVGEFVEWMTRARDLGLGIRMLDATLARRRIHGGNTVLTRSGADYLRAIKMTLDRRRAGAGHGG